MSVHVFPQKIFAVEHRLSLLDRSMVKNNTLTRLAAITICRFAILLRQIKNLDDPFFCLQRCRTSGCLKITTIP